MVAKWIKFLRKQDKEISFKIYNIVEKILLWNFEWLDIKKIRWKNWYYRCRVWLIRIIFIDVNWKIIIDKIWYRWEVYKWL